MHTSTVVYTQSPTRARSRTSSQQKCQLIQTTTSSSTEPTVAFTEIAAPSTDEERQAIRTSTVVAVTPVGSTTATNYTIGFVPWAKSGDVIGTGTNNVFGQHVNYLGAVMDKYSGADLTIGTNKGIQNEKHY